MKNINYLFLYFILGLLAIGCSTNEKKEAVEKKTKKETTVSETEKAINQLVKDAYTVITFEKGTTPDYVAMKALFTPEATLYNFRNDSLKFYFIDDFIAEFKDGNFAG